MHPLQGVCECVYVGGQGQGQGQGRKWCWEWMRHGRRRWKVIRLVVVAAVVVAVVLVHAVEVAAGAATVVDGSPATLTMTDE